MAGFKAHKPKEWMARQASMTRMLRKIAGLKSVFGRAKKTAYAATLRGLRKEVNGL